MNNRKKEQGITLIALAVTIIVLLIVAGITISAISGTDGIINGANESKNKTAIVEEKQILNTSVAASIGKSPKAKVEEANLKYYCNQNIGEENKDYTLEKEDKHFNLKFSSTGNEYVILEDGTILTKQEYNSKIEKEQKGQIIIEVGTKEKVTVETESESVVDWKSKDESIAKVNIENVKNVKEAEILGIKNGETTVTATLKNGEKVQYDIVVQTSPKSIALNENNITLDLSIDPKKQLVVSYDPVTTNVNKKITWTSSDTKVATVDSNGIVKGVKNGKDVIITATTENGKSATCKVTVQTTPISVTLNKTNVTLDLSTNKTVQLTATVNPSTANVQNVITWRSNDTSTATVSQSGLVTGVKNGSTTVTAKTTNGKIVTCAVTVQTTPTSVTLNQTNVTLDLSTNKTVQLTATVNPNTANVKTGVTWKSKDTSIATVSQSGVVTGVRNGSATITATTGNGKSASCSVTIITSVTSISVSPTSKTLKTGETVQLTAIKNPSTTTEGIVWTTSNSSVATVSNGLVTAKGSGTATITVKSSTSGKSATCTITVSNPVQTKSYSLKKYYGNWLADYGEKSFTGYKEWTSYDLGGSYNIESLSGSITIKMTSNGKEEMFCTFGVKIEAYNGSSWDVIYKRTREYGTWLTSGASTISESIQGFKDIHDVKNDTMDGSPSSTEYSNSLTHQNKKYSKIRLMLYLSNTVPESLSATGSVSLNVY